MSLAGGLNLNLPATRVRVDRTVEQAGAGDYDGLLVPGGFINPDLLRQSAPARGLVREFVDSGKPVVTLCHGRGGGSGRQERVWWGRGGGGSGQAAAPVGVERVALEPSWRIRLLTLANAGDADDARPGSDGTDCQDDAPSRCRTTLRRRVGDASTS